MWTSKKWGLWAGVVVVTAAALLYLFTLDNGLRPQELTGGDLITHQYAQVQGRPGNAPGYPLYTMGGWLWFRLGSTLRGGVLNPIQILSMYSMLWGLASLAVLYAILLRVTRRQWAIALLLTAFYAVTYFFWYYSVTTEQYTGAVFQTLLIIWLAFRWDDSPRDSTLLWLAFVSGTLLANMVTTLFILPPLLWFVFFKRDSQGWLLVGYLKRPKLIVQVIAVTLLPLLAYAYVYIRGAQHPEWRGQGVWESTWAWFIQFITIQQGRDELAPGLTLQTSITPEFPALIWQELTWLVFLGGLVGLGLLGRRRAIFLYSTLVIYLFFCFGYRFGNWFQVIIPAYPIFIIGFAAGLTRLTETMSRGGEGATRRRGKDSDPPVHNLPPPTQNSELRTQNSKPTVTIVVLVLAGLLAYRFATNLPRANQHDRADDTGLDPGWAILADSPQAPAVVVANFEEKVALDYLTAIWNVSPGITPANPNDLPAFTSQNLYITRQAANVAPELVQPDRHPQAAGEQLIALPSSPPVELPASATPAALQFGDSLQLAGWEVVDTPGPNWQLALYWQSLAALEIDYTMSVRPLLADQPMMQAGELLIQDHRPVWGLYPTSRWQPGQLVRDVYALPLPNSPDAVQVVVYRVTESGFENLADHVIPLDE